MRRFAVGAGLCVQIFKFALEVFILALQFSDLLLKLCYNVIQLVQLVLHVGEGSLNSFFKIHGEIVSNEAIKVKSG